MLSRIFRVTRVRVRLSLRAIFPAKPYPVQDWLRTLPLAPKTGGHIRSLMYRLFEKAMLWELIPLTRKSITLVQLNVVSKHLKHPRILTEYASRPLRNHPAHPYLCLVLL